MRVELPELQQVPWLNQRGGEESINNHGFTLSHHLHLGTCDVYQVKASLGGLIRKIKHEYFNYKYFIAVQLLKFE